jgi:RHH-type proline utilization regulon transcriptional repressor/proline dehydrogenase/delta 1-pyrroline-5-carboxylate dehydrogenase
VPRLQRFARPNAIDPVALGGLRELGPPDALHRFVQALGADAPAGLREVCEEYLHATPVACRFELPGPTGESNVLNFRGRGRALCLPGEDPFALWFQLAAVFATGNRALCRDDAQARAAIAGLPELLRAQVDWTGDWSREQFDVALWSGDDAQARELRLALAKRDGARVRLVRAVDGRYELGALVAEQSIAINTAAAGGNASLMTLEQA